LANQSAADLIADLDLALLESPNHVGKKIEDMTADMTRMRKGITENGKKFVDSLQDTMNMDAVRFQGWLQEKHSAMQGKFRSEDMTMPFRSLEGPFEVPEERMIRDDPEYKCKVSVAGADIVGPPITVNELQYRVMLSHKMLGQTIERAAKLAEIVFDHVMEPLFNEIASKFCMSGNALKEEMSNFKNEEMKEGRWPEDAEDMLISFIDKENFKYMYVGVVLWSATPLAFSCILPTMWDETLGRGGDLSAEAYPKLIARARSILTGSSCKSRDLSSIDFTNL